MFDGQMLKVWLTERPLLVAVAFGFFLWVVLLLLAQMLWVLVLQLVAIILATVMMPVVRVMRRVRVPRLGWRIPRWVAVLILYLAVLAILSLVVYQVVLVLIGELRLLLDSLPSLLQGFLLGITQFEESTGLAGILPSGTDLLDQAQAALTNLVSSPGRIAEVLGGIGWFFFGLFFVLALALFLVEESEPILEFTVSLFPPLQRERARVVIAHIGNRVGHWLLGQITVAVVSGILAGLGVWILGLPYPFLFGAGTTLLDLAPMVGPSLMGIPAALLGLSHSPLIAALAALLFYGISFLDGQVLSPLITGRFVQLKMSLVLSVVPLGLVLYGALGALVAIPVTAGLVVFATEVLLPWLRRHQGVPAGQAGNEDEEHKD